MDNNLEIVYRTDTAIMNRSFKKVHENEAVYLVDGLELNELTIKVSLYSAADIDALTALLRIARNCFYKPDLKF